MASVFFGNRKFSPTFSKAMKAARRHDGDVPVSKRVEKEFVKHLVEAYATGKYEELFDNVISAAPKGLHRRITELVTNGIREPAFLAGLVNYGVAQMKKTGQLKTVIWSHPASGSFAEVVAKRAPRKGDSVMLRFGPFDIKAKVGSATDFAINTRTVKSVDEGPSAVHDIQGFENRLASAAAMNQGAGPTGAGWGGRR